MKRISLILLPTIIIGFATSGCFYDKESDLYQQALCDTTTVTYICTIKPIISTSCSYAGCHDGSRSNGGGINLTNYAGLHEKVMDNSLLGAIQHEQGYVKMPQDNGKLPECQISQIRTWVILGAPDN